MNIEQYIRNNAEAFNEEPADGHFERFLEKRNRSRRRKPSLRILLSAAAASVILALAAGIGMLGGERGDDTVARCDNAADMKGCYMERMYRTAEQIGELSRKLDSDCRAELMYEVESLLARNIDIEYEIPEELPVDIAAGIRRQAYALHLECLQSIVLQLKTKQ